MVSKNTHDGHIDIDRHPLRFIGSGALGNNSDSTLEESLSRSWQPTGTHQDLIRRKSSLRSFHSIDPDRLRDNEDIVLAAIRLGSELTRMSSQIERLPSARSLWSSQKSLILEGDDGSMNETAAFERTLECRLKTWREGGSGSQKDHSYKLSSYRQRRSVIPLSTTPSGFHHYHFSRLPTSKARRRSHLVTNADDSHRYRMYNRIEGIALGIAESMDDLHARQMVHRDLRPATIAWEGDDEEGDESGSPRIRLLDFGTSGSVTDAFGDGPCESNPRYTAPEVLSGTAHSFGSDVYSFGVVLFEMSSLRIPYEDNYWCKKNGHRTRDRWSILRKLVRRKRPSDLISRSSNSQTSSRSSSSKTKQMADFCSEVAQHRLLPCEDLESAIPCCKIRALVHDCWKPNPHDRPSFSQIVARLEVIFRRPRPSRVPRRSIPSE